MDFEQRIKELKADLAEEQAIAAKLQAEREIILAEKADAEKTQKRFAYAAHATGNDAAREKLEAAELVLSSIDQRLASYDVAIAESNRRIAFVQNEIAELEKPAAQSALVAVFDEQKPVHAKIDESLCALLDALSTLDAAERKMASLAQRAGIERWRYATLEFEFVLDVLKNLHRYKNGKRPSPIRQAVGRRVERVRNMLRNVEQNQQQPEPSHEVTTDAAVAN